MAQLRRPILYILVTAIVGTLLGGLVGYLWARGQARYEFVQLSQQTIDSVVNISTISIEPEQLGDREEAYRKYFDEFLGPGLSPRADDAEDAKVYLGSGFLVEPGLILTSYHVVSGAERIMVRFTEEADEVPSRGLVVGTDPELDIALISVAPKVGHPPLKLGDSDRLEVGEKVVAIGNPFGQGHSVTQGIISAKNRDGEAGTLARYLQTDAPINPGNSGGPLLNLRGEVIGLNSAIESRGQGIGFAIPANLVKQVLPELMSKGTVARGDLGVTVNVLNPEIAAHLNVPKNLRAPFVAEVTQPSPGGLEAYDVILKVGDRAVETEQDLIRLVSQLPAGKKTQVTVMRGGQEKLIQALVRVRDAEPIANAEAPIEDEAPPSYRELGVVLEDLSAALAQEFQLPESAQDGVIVTDLDPTSEAASSGLLRGDVLLEIDRKPINAATQFYERIQNGGSFLVKVRRYIAETDTETYRVLVLEVPKG
jgi:serine protease Do